MYHCPEVSKHIEDDFDSSFWFCEAFEAVHIGVADYCGTDFDERSILQVISTDMTIFEPAMD